jgi:hypothetical protein
MRSRTSIAFMAFCDLQLRLKVKKVESTIINVITLFDSLTIKISTNSWFRTKFHE